MDSLSNRTLAATLTELANTANADSLSNRTLMATTLANLAAMESLSNTRHRAILSEIASLMTSDRPMSTEEETTAPPVPPTPPTLCGKCHGPIEDPFRGVDYCCVQYCHDAGDRRHCIRGFCSCTGFAIKRRQLREHRQKMRVMEQLIVDNGLEDELEVAMEEDGCPDHHRLWSDAEMDEGSDAEDPMETQANELSNVASIVQLSRNMVELTEIRRGLERARGSDQDA